MLPSPRVIEQIAAEDDYRTLQKEINRLQEENQALCDALSVTRGAADSARAQAGEAWDLLRQVHEAVHNMIDWSDPHRDGSWVWMSPLPEHYERVRALINVLAARLGQPTTIPLSAAPQGGRTDPLCPYRGAPMSTPNGPACPSCLLVFPRNALTVAGTVASHWPTDDPPAPLSAAPQGGETEAG